MGLMAARVPFTKMKCGGWTECETEHDFLAPEDVLLIQMAIPLDHFEEHGGGPDKLPKALANHWVVQTDQAIIPTALGLWVEDASSN